MACRKMVFSRNVRTQPCNGVYAWLTAWFIAQSSAALITAGMKSLAAFAILPLATACATIPATTVPALGGTEWRFTAIDGTPPVSDRAEMEFTAARLSATVGCNGMGGAWRLDGNRLVGGPYMSTRMYCENVMAQEQAVGALLEADPVVMVSGDTMTLTTLAHSAVLRRND